MVLKERLRDIPTSAGVYIFKDENGGVLYIGKANNLRQRLRYYLGRFLSSKTQTFVSKIKDVSYIMTSSSAQAQLLEAALIKRHLPVYNISLRDDKSFPLIRITDESFPVVSICRRKKRSEKDTSIYFGPYTSAKLLREALKTIREIFGFRSCLRMPRKPCLYYRLRLCPAPCIGKINSGQYREIIENIQMFLESRYEELLSVLSYKMKQASQEQRFEKAARIRNQIHALSTIGQSKISSSCLNELEGLSYLLRLEKLPLRIEAFDISNIFGKEACGSMVSFYKGVADKNNYRRFRIKAGEDIDDYKMLREVIQRRYSRLIEENLPLPDLIIIDGGRSHLLVADKEIKKLGIGIPIVGIAKPNKVTKGNILKTRGRESIYIKDKVGPIRLDSDTPALNLIRRIRNEAHRFALAYHHILRRKKIIGK